MQNTKRRRVSKKHPVKIYTRNYTHQASGNAYEDSSFDTSAGFTSSDPDQTVDKVLMAAVSQIWAEYDTDGNNWLDKDEMRPFVLDILSECKISKNYNDTDFNRVFSMFDTDGDGKVSKEEMFTFIKNISGLD